MLNKSKVFMFIVMVYMFMAHSNISYIANNNKGFNYEN